jgi:hypothetical protein
MAEITKSSKASLATTNIPPSCQVGSGLIAGEDLGTLDACYIKASDGKVYKATGAAANAAAKPDGFAALAAKSGEAVTLIEGCDVRYGSSLTKAARLYLSGSVAGGLADAASTGGTVPIAKVLDSTRIRLLHLS